MRYDRIHKGIFIQRPNRFTAYIQIGGKLEVCHVKNTGRCKELLLAGSEVLVQESSNPKRKTKYDLIAVWKGQRLINIDSQAPNIVFREWLKESGYFSDLKTVKPEVRYGGSRFDYYLEAADKRIFAEVKGVTLEENGVALFPDAPTERGVKHLKELAACLKEGYEAMVVFIVQMKGISFMMPNDKMHPEFGDALRKLYAQGAKVMAVDCLVTEEMIVPGSLVEVKLNY